jgi:hypothetical protein
MALVFFWMTADDTAEVFYAQKWKGWLTEDLAREFHRVCETEGFRPRWTVIDPAGKRGIRRRAEHAGRPQGSEGSDDAGPEQGRRGHRRRQGRLRTQRLLVHADQEQLVGEFRNYRWKNTDKSTSEDEPKREPIKANDDLLDALRYGLMSMPVKAKRERPTRSASCQPRIVCSVSSSGGCGARSVSASALCARA